MKSFAKEEWLLNVIVYIIAGVSTAGVIAMWFASAGQILRARRDTVCSAESQYTACLNGRQAVSVLMRSQDIYNQSVTIYNATLKLPRYRIPGFFMGYKAIKEKPLSSNKDKIN